MRKVNVTPYISRDPRSLHHTVHREMSDHAQRLNDAIVADGEEPMRAPLKLATSTIAGLADFPAADWTNGLIIVSNETGGLTVAFSDGTNWRRVQDRAVVS